MADRAVGPLVGPAVELDEDVKDGDGDVAAVGPVVGFEGGCDTGPGPAFASDKIETVTLLKKKGWTLRLLHIDIKRFVYNTYGAFLRYLKKSMLSHWAYLINDTDIEALF